MSTKRGITLTEILVAIAIIALVSALMLPVIVATKGRSLETPCASNLRQLFTAWQLYADSEDAEAPNLQAIYSYSASVASVAACPADSFGGANKRVSKALNSRVSYYYMPSRLGFREALREADANHGIMYCVVHGKRVATPAEPDAERDTTGLVLRLRRDGSVHRPLVGRMCSASSTWGRIEGRQQWSLLTDAKCVEPFCDGLSEACGP